MDDVQFTFDYLPFMTGIDKISAGMNKFLNIVKTVSSTAGKGVAASSGFAAKLGQAFSPDNAKKMKEMSGGGKEGIGTWAIAKGNLIAMAISGAFKKAFASIKAHIPELAQTMSIASDIFMRNLLWPLRQELAPYLQKLLNWVRDSRGMFVRWGGVLVNIFRGMKELVGGMIKGMEAGAKRFAQVWEKQFGPIKKSFTEVLNMIIFKLVGFIMFVQEALRPLNDSIGALLGFIAVGVKGLFDGFMDGIEPIMEPLGEIIDMLLEFLDTLTGGEGNAKAFYDIMAGIGDLIGTTLVVAFDVLAIAVKGLITLLKTVWNLGKAVVKLFQGDFKGAWGAVKDIGSDFADTFKFGAKKFGDAYDRGMGFKSRTEARAKPYIDAARATEAIENQEIQNRQTYNNEAAVNIGEVKIQSNAEDAEGIAKDVAGMLNEKIKRMLEQQMQLAGRTQ
jgi:hypothetical protein